MVHGSHLCIEERKKKVMSSKRTNGTNNININSGEVYQIHI